MKTILLFLICVLLGFVIITTFKYALISRKTSEKNITPIPSVSSFSISKAPTSSLVAEMINFAGEVAWQSREATAPALINSYKKIQQGELLKTLSGSTTIEYKGQIKMTLSPHSELSVIQTLPQNLVFAQNEGTIDYQRIGDLPVSIKILHLLIDQSKGIIQISLDKEKETVTIDVKEGKITLAFNNLELKTNLLDIENGKRVIFHDNTREIETKDLK